MIIGLLRGMRDDLGLLYLDGVIDLNTPATTHSGILDGMGIAHVIGLADDALSAIGPQQPLLPDERILLFGYDPAEQEAIKLEAVERRKYSATHRLRFATIRRPPPVRRSTNSRATQSVSCSTSTSTSSTQPKCR